MLKHIIMICILLLFGKPIFAQFTVGSTETFYTKNGETLFIDGLTLYPSLDFTITDNSLQKLALVNHATPNLYIQRVYRFTNNTAIFNGTIQMNYQDEELNGIPEANLQLNIHNGVNWQAFNSSTSNIGSNYVITVALNNVILNELTMANSLAALPLYWLSFTAVKKENDIQLYWTTVNEQNTKDFVVQHSMDGLTWNPIGLLAAKGSLQQESTYSFTHKNPMKGNNIYRLIQRDNDGASSYSKVVHVMFQDNTKLFSIYPNPVINGQLHIQTQTAGTLFVYNQLGVLVQQQKVESGLQTIRLSNLAKGVYNIQLNQEILKLVIQ